jgi:hypothetical protein
MTPTQNHAPAETQDEHKIPGLLDTLIDDAQAKQDKAIASRYRPVMPIDELLARDKFLKQIISGVMVEGIDGDFSEIPGTSRGTDEHGKPIPGKKVLLQPGAQKVCSLFGYVPVFEDLECIEDWMGKDHGKEAMFYSKVRCRLEKDGHPVGEGIGSANSWESKHRYRWVAEPPANLPKSLVTARTSTLVEFEFAVNKAETGGKYGKAPEYWQQFHEAIHNGTARKFMKESARGPQPAWEITGTVYKVPNPDFPDIVNTIQKIACKRALVSAVLLTTGLSSYMTQDLEDMAREAWDDTPRPMILKPATLPAQAQAPQNAPAAAAPATPAKKPKTMDEVKSLFGRARARFLELMGDHEMFETILREFDLTEEHGLFMDPAGWEKKNKALSAKIFLRLKETLAQVEKQHAEMKAATAQAADDAFSDADEDHGTYGQD